MGPEEMQLELLRNINAVAANMPPTLQTKFEALWTAYLRGRTATIVEVVDQLREAFPLLFSPELWEFLRDECERIGDEDPGACPPIYNMVAAWSSDEALRQFPQISRNTDEQIVH